MSSCEAGEVHPWDSGKFQACGWIVGVPFWNTSTGSVGDKSLKSPHDTCEAIQHALCDHLTFKIQPETPPRLGRKPFPLFRKPSQEPFSETNPLKCPHEKPFHKMVWKFGRKLSHAQSFRSQPPFRVTLVPEHSKPRSFEGLFDRRLSSKWDVGRSGHELYKNHATHGTMDMSSACWVLPMMESHGN